MPGNTNYNDMVKKRKNFTILGDIIGGIKQNEMNKHSKGNIQLKAFRGATCKDMLRVFFFKNWYSLHARLNNHYEA